MNKRRKSITRRVRSTRSGEYDGEEIKQYVAGLNELRKPGVSCHEEKAVLPERIISSSEGGDIKDDDDDFRLPADWKIPYLSDGSKRLEKVWFKWQLKNKT